MLRACLFVCHAHGPSIHPPLPSFILPSLPPLSSFSTRALLPQSPQRSSTSRRLASWPTSHRWGARWRWWWGWGGAACRGATCWYLRLYEHNMRGRRAGPLPRSLPPPADISHDGTCPECAHTARHLPPPCPVTLQLMEASQYRMLSKAEWDAAQAEDFLVSGWGAAAGRGRPEQGPRAGGGGWAGGMVPAPLCTPPPSCTSPRSPSSHSLCSPLPPAVHAAL